MSTKLFRIKTLLFVAAVMTAVTAIACAADEPEAPSQPAAAAAAKAPQATQPAPSVAPAPQPGAPRQPDRAAPSAAPQAPTAAMEGADPVAPGAAPSARPSRPAAPAAPAQPDAPSAPQAAAAAAAATAPKAPTGPAAVATGFKWVPPVATPDTFYPKPDEYDGPVPTRFSESPMSAALVKTGAILPLAQRIPPPEDVRIYPVSDEIGVYGGTRRAVSHRAQFVDYFSSTSGGVDWNRFGLQHLGGHYKSITRSEDGRTFTYTDRKNMRWGDGYPHTMEDHRFALEDLMLNKELMPGLPSQLTSPVTGNDFTFKVVDDLSYTMSWDDPNWPVMESSGVSVFSSMRGCPRCYIHASHIFKRYHTKYNSAEIPALLEKWEQPTWTKMYVSVRNVRANPGLPSEAVPTTFDPNYIYKGDHYVGWLGSWLTEDLGDTRQRFTRNHYFFGADPEGNQLPYVDALESYASESQDVSMFRLLAGEADYDRRIPTLGQLPLMLQNMEKGDFSVFRYTALDGADAFYQSNQEFVGDTEIGSLLRTQDFRVAMSLAWNRNAGNEIALSGLGTPQNNNPHPDTPYAAEDNFRYQDVERNVAKSKQLLAKLGLTMDGDMLMRKDGGGQLSLFHQSGATYFPMMELLQSDLKDVGIAVSIKEGSARAGMTADDITEYYEWWTTTEGGTNPWGNIWNANAPTHPANGSPGMGKYFQTRGESGMAPTGPDPKFTDAYGNMAPDGTYPADITGKLQELQNLWSDGNVRDLYDPARIEMGKDIYRISGEWHFNTNMTGFSGISRALSVKRNNVRNHARNGITGTGQPTDQLYFEGGIDNVNNPGNRSRLYKSVSFLDASYWNPVLGK